MNTYEKPDLQKIYGCEFIDKRAPGYYPLEKVKTSNFFKPNFFIDSVVFHVTERLSLDPILKELSFFLIALFTYLYMQNSGRILKLHGFGILIGYALIAAMGYNFFKASFKSLAPGIIGLVVGLILISNSFLLSYFSFISIQSINYFIGFSALCIALSLFRK